MAQIPGTPKLESRNCPETVPGGVPGLWELITPDCKLGSQRGLNRSCSPRRGLSNGVSHSLFGLREEVDSRLFVIVPLAVSGRQPVPRGGVHNSRIANRHSVLQDMHEELQGGELHRH
ncbi:unnamed protein product [Sphagnum jensenii]|uniref:Uncharacterized protein n=1 Tax=Sphagnum jensenii TaxID=128206 RepID=A0ABP1BTG6_9BRYO